MKGKIILGFITIIISVFLFFVRMDMKEPTDPKEGYQVYLNGNKLGIIKSKDTFLDLINKEQTKIKEKYNVEKVYPPNGLKIQKIYTFNDDIVSEKSIYEQVEKIEPFTIEGYVATITYTEEKIINDQEEILAPRDPKKIYLLKKNIMEDALYNTAAAFIGTEDLKKYQDKTQKVISDNGTGEVINSVYFEETISIKKDLISTNDYIFSDVDELSQYLLFGTLNAQKIHIAKSGEDLYSIADANNLNIEELLIANPQYQIKKDPTSDGTVKFGLLEKGDQVNVALIEPLVSVVYNKTIVENVDVQYKTELVKDNTKYTSYRMQTQKGQNGRVRVTQDVKYVNGEIHSLNTTKREVLIETINEVVTVGTKLPSGSGYKYYDKYDCNSEWCWPTIAPFKISSGFSWRWGRQHEGIDISGCGYGSPIYVVNDGYVYNVNHDSSRASGLAIYVDHGNGYTTVYMHLSKILVKEGDYVKRQQKIGQMGMTGRATGVHLHLGVFKGRAYQGGKSVDPCASIFTC